MNVQQFQEGVKLMSHAGFKLTEMESALIEYSLIILQSEQKFRDVFFVGRIDTCGTDRYYIAFGYRKDILKGRKFFYSLNGYEWLMMPEVKPKMVPISRHARTFFKGDPAHIEFVSMPPTFLPDEEEVFLQCPPSVKKIKEEDRLACFVHLLMSQAIVPRGALYRQVNRCVTANPCFRGLTLLAANELKNFQLLRYPINDPNYNLTKREDYNYQTDFFDTIEDLFPPNSFKLHTNDRDVCLIRSLKLPGLNFYHKLNTIYQGFFYLGNALENLDLFFML